MTVLAGLAVLVATGPAVADGHLAKATVSVCIDRVKGPAMGEGYDGCFVPEATTYRHTAERDDDALFMALPVPQSREFLARLDNDDPDVGEVRICVINGANICFEGPMEIVWVCITTGMLAGSECPPLNEPLDVDEPIAIVHLTAR